MTTDEILQWLQVTFDDCWIGDGKDFWNDIDPSSRNIRRSNRHHPGQVQLLRVRFIDDAHGEMFLIEAQKEEGSLSCFFEVMGDGLAERISLFFFTNTRVVFS